MASSARRILSLWFPRLAAERVLRREACEAPLAIVAPEGQRQVLASLTAAAEAAGLRRGMALTDARAICPGLVTRPAAPFAEAAFVAALRRWAGRFSPWVAEEGTEGLVLDVTGVAHLFGGEAGLAASVAEGAAALGLTLRLGLADTVGAAWALARYGGARPVAARSGDAIDQEAPATRARAAKRPHWAREAANAGARALFIAAPGATLAAIAPLPVAGLRVGGETLEGLARLGLRRIGDLVGLPRGALARRFGVELVRRLDQALGAEPEPVSPRRPETRFAVRLTLPEPIGLAADVEAGAARLMAPLCAALERAGMAARRVRLELRRVDHGTAAVEVGLARPSREPARILSLLAMKLGEVEAGFGIDMLRLSAPVAEPLAETQHRGALAAEAEARARAEPGGGEDFAALLSRLGVRLGLERLIRFRPAESHIPEKTAIAEAAAFAAPAPAWPAPPGPRPLTLMPPEPVEAQGGRPPTSFRWRRRTFEVAFAEGPERIAPEWWLDDPAWRSGPRDYWRIETADGTRLWLFEAHGGERPGGWFVQGQFG
ncbi:MAG TPA: DNA polymerase Y family protein [Paracoccaceae bacterium]|nr:DNA polymerase Y family protein [Paracoccaceae bacterium]